MSALIASFRCCIPVLSTAVQSGKTQTDFRYLFGFYGTHSALIPTSPFFTEYSESLNFRFFCRWNRYRKCGQSGDIKNMMPK